MQRMQSAGWVVVLFCLTTPAAPPVMGAMDADDEFLRSLDLESAGNPVNAEHLARFFFGIASTLQGGLHNVEVLEETIPLRDPQRASTIAIVEREFDAYARAAGEFKASGLRLLDRPASPRILFELLTEGHRTCWKLNGYVSLLEASGAPRTALLSALSSSEACAKFRRAAFHPRVGRRVLRALRDEREVDQENRALRQELEELERLLEDLKRIDAAD